MKSVSHREAKKIATMHAIYDAAVYLFVKYGYSKTTLTAIAAKAGVSQRTIFSYFPSKEAIIFHYDQAITDGMVDCINARSDNSVFEAIKLYLDNNEALLHQRLTKKEIARRNLVRTTPILWDYMSVMLLKLEDNLVAALAEERGLQPDSLQARLVAASCRAAIYYEIEIQTGVTPAQFNIVTTFIEAGIAATKTNR